MGRWEPNALERLQRAAMEAFIERGYDRTTVEEIAARAGLTERTFFRYFADKREVLFSGSERLQALMLGGIAAAEPDATPLELISAALAASSALFVERRAYARKRQSLIVQHAELREREVSKLASLARALGEKLRERGMAKAAAELVAEAGIAVFKSAFERWLYDPEKRELAEHVHVALAELKLVFGEAGPPSRRAATATAAPPRAQRRPSDDVLRFPSAVKRDPAVDEWLEAQRDDLRPFVRTWFELMRQCGPDVRELMHDGCPTACVGDAGFGYVAAFKHHANVGFLRGALLDDPSGLLQGSGKRGRHVKLWPGRELDAAALAQLVRAAYAEVGGTAQPTITESSRRSL